MADFRLLYPSDYIGSHDLMGKDVTKTIKTVSVDLLQMTGGKKEKKPVVHFSDSTKKLVMNKTNAKLIAALHGNDTDKWRGKKITMYPTTTQFGRDTVDCVRVRSKGKPAPQEAPADENPFDVAHGAPVDELDPEPGAGDAP